MAAPIDTPERAIRLARTIASDISLYNEEKIIRGLFEAFLDTPRPDQPDRTALVDNPLAPFGGVDR